MSQMNGRESAGDGYCNRLPVRAIERSCEEKFSLNRCKKEREKIEGKEKKWPRVRENAGHLEYYVTYFLFQLVVLYR